VAITNTYLIAVHTHSPKAGQGMNVSMHDTYNLGWKLGAVLNGTAQRSILKTYESERRPIAQQLIEFDTKFAFMFSGRPAKDIADEAGISMEDFKTTFQKGNAFTSGLSVRYGASKIVAQEHYKSASADPAIPKSALHLGSRLPSFQVVCQCDATPIQLGDVLKSDGSWRLLVFPGDLRHEASMQRLKTVGEKLDRSSPCSSPFLTTSCVQPILIHASPRREVELFDLPKAFYCSSRAENGGFDYYRIFADDESYHQGHGHAYENYGIAKNRGLVVLVRPDQYISWMGGLEDIEEAERLLSGILRR
jgi:phenol 2-monooxygenase (NADPH)